MKTLPGFSLITRIKSKWHFVFIVNENTNDAKNYKKIVNYSDPELFKEDNF